jgi:hypothetical protein
MLLSEARRRVDALLAGSPLRDDLSRIIALTFCQLLGDSWKLTGCGVAHGSLAYGRDRCLPKCRACPDTCGSINGEAARSRNDRTTHLEMPPPAAGTVTSSSISSGDRPGYA